ncbi:MAG: Lrp/AsnC ligand binding domain-containing protein [Candidatus Nitrosocosmicus sp.]|nr:Lrp/AsnC ligand binding domain-containing protein [Candidatus Nitrosocosmicus sp.]
MTATAIVVLNCELGAEKKIIKEISRISGVDEVKEVIGFYDIVMQISAVSVDELKETIIKKIKVKDKVSSTMTLIMNDRE